MSLQERESTLYGFGRTLPLHPPWPHGHLIPVASKPGRFGSHSRSQKRFSEPGNSAVQPGEQRTRRRAHAGPGPVPVASGEGMPSTRHVGLTWCGARLAFGVIVSQHVRQHGILSTRGTVCAANSAAS